MKLTFPVLKLQFLGAQHIHASRGIWEARDSSVIQNGLCLGLNGPISKIFTRMMNMGYWWILSEAILPSFPSSLFSLLLLYFSFWEVQKLGVGPKYFWGCQRPREAQGRWRMAAPGEKTDMNLIKFETNYTHWFKLNMSYTSLCKKQHLYYSTCIKCS